MFSKIRGRRTTALATTLAVVIGLAITPALTATAAEGDPVEGSAPVAIVEPAAPEAVPAPAAPAPEAPIAPEELTIEVAPTPVEESAPVVEAGHAQVQSPIAPLAAPMAAPATGTIAPSTVGPFVVNQRITDVRFTHALNQAKWVATGLPGGLVLNNNSGWLTGTPNAAGDYSVVVTAQICSSTCQIVGSGTYLVTVQGSAPVVTTTGLPGATVGVFYSQQLAASNGPNTFTVSHGSLPAELTLSPSGEISGTPAFVDGYDGSDQISFSVIANNGADSVAKQLSITVTTPAPAFGNTPLAAATVGEPYTQALPLAIGYGTLTYSVFSGQLPAGLTLGSDGIITGTPEYDSAYSPTNLSTFGARVTGPTGSAGQLFNFELKVNPAPIITTDTIPAATVGSAYTTVIAASGINVTFTATSANRGVQISPTGELTWTPSSQRSVSVEVTATNPSGSDTKTFQLESYALPTITTTTLGFGIVGQSFAPTVDFTGRSASVTVTAGALPTGLSMFKTGKFKGEPTAPGTYSFTVTVTNPVGSASQPFEVTVYDIPAINTWSLDRATVGDSYLDTIQFTGLDAEAALVGGALPAGLVLNADGTITGTPTEEGTFPFWVQVSNPAGSDTRGYSIRSFEVPEITTASIDSAVTGVAFRDRIRATGDQTVFTVVRGSLPDGLTLTQRGVLKGTATEAGTFTFIVRAKNPVGADRQQFTITVTTPAVQLSVSSIIRGNTMTVTGSGFKPGDDLELWLHSTPVLLGTATATGGTFTSTVVIPANTAAGLHHLVVVGAQSGTHSVPLTIALPAAVTPAPAAPAAPATQASVQSRGSQQAAVEPAEETTISDSTQVEEVEAPVETEVEAELETLDQPVADGEKPVAPAADWTGLVVGAFALLLAALLVLFLIWRRRRALES